MRTVFCFILTALALRPATALAEPIVITLRDKATVSTAQATLGDVAGLQGGDDKQRERLARLDLADVPLSSQAILITRYQIAFRLRLAGFDEDSFRLEGPSCVRVARPAGEALDDKIAAVARAALERQLGNQAADVVIQLAQPVRLPALSADGEDIHLEPELRTAAVPPCRVMVEVGLYVRGARRTSVQVYLDVKKLQSSPIAVRRIEVGEAFTTDNVRMERTPVEYGGKTAIDAASLMGQRAHRPIAAGRAIESDDLEAAGPSAVVIHQSDLVHLVAAVGPLQVRARGQALQEGRIGQLIQVRNTDSQSIVTGRVKDRSTVEVDY